jgi:hypothetical protein
VLTVRPWQAGISAAVLPRAYQDIIEVFADHGAGMPRAGRWPPTLATIEPRSQRCAASPSTRGCQDIA